MAEKPAISLQAWNWAAADVLEQARAADRLGFDTYWLAEHYVVPKEVNSDYPLTAGRARHIMSPDTHLHDLFCLLGAVAGATQRLRVGTAINVVPLNHPLHLARATTTLHAASGGRLLYGTGAGWAADEFNAFGVPIAERGGRLQETFEILRKAWAGGFFKHSGRYFDFAELQITPAPTPIPLIGGGRSDAALRRTAKLADGWISYGALDLDTALQLRDRLETLRAEAGVRDRPFEYYLRLDVASPEEADRFAREGFNHLIFWVEAFWPRDPDVPLSEKQRTLADAAARFGLEPKGAF